MTWREAAALAVMGVVCLAVGARSTARDGKVIAGMIFAAAVLLTVLS